MANYTSTTLISQYLQRSLTANETAFLTGVGLNAIRLWFNAKFSSRFDEVSESTRYYEGGSRTVDIDPCTAISAVKYIDNEGTENYSYVDSSDYVAEPVNETVKRELVKRYGRFPSGLRRIAVTAKFSEYDGAIPDDIQLAATHMAAALLSQGRTTSAGGAVSSESLDGHTIHYDTGSNALDAIANDDPVISGVLQYRRELLIG